MNNLFKCDQCNYHDASHKPSINCPRCGVRMRIFADDIKNDIGPRGSIHLIPKPVNYIATYQAQLVDGDQATANLALENVPANASPASVIEMITEQAYADIARSGMNAHKVLVLNLSRVW